MDYSQLSDRDIDAQVLHKIYGNQANDKDIMRAWLRGGFKYTANPADAWTIISENKINIEWHEWKGGDFRPYALNSASMKSAYDSNPLRAAMIVFLMMQEQGNT